MPILVRTITPYLYKGAAGDVNTYPWASTVAEFYDYN